MEIFDKKSITHLQLKIFEEKSEFVYAGFSTRNGGVSSDRFSTLNMGLHVLDEPENVIENRGKLAKELNAPLETWVCLDQTHGSNVHVATFTDKGKGTTSYNTAISNCDAVITKEKNMMLFTCYADCVPLYFLDPIEEIIGLAHAGWKGTAKNIGKKTIDEMIKLGSKKENIVTAIGPSICSKCYSVSSDVTNQLIEAMQGNEVGIEQRNGKLYVDLKQVNHELFIQQGLQSQQIFQTNYCTSCESELFFSHRRDAGITGRNASFIIQR